MKNIYRISINFHDFMMFTLDEYELITKLGEDFTPQHFGTSIKDMWNTVDAKFIASDSGSIILPDISRWMPNLLIFNQKAYDILSTHLKDYGEMLDINIDSKSYYLFNIMKYIDDAAIDQTSSKKAIVDGIEIGVQSLCFKHEKISDDILLFKTNYDRGSNIFCSDNLKQLIEDSDLTGIDFEKELAINPL